MSFIVSVTFLPPALTVILSRRRRISVYTAYETNGNKYHSAGRSLCMQRRKQSAADFWLGPACCFGIHKQKQHYGDWPPNTVSRLKGRPLIGQARGQLRLTWRSYAGPPQPPPIRLRRTSPRESVSRGSQVAFAPLRTTFACHPYSGGRIKPQRNNTVTSITKFSAARISPLRGRRHRQATEGVHFHRPSRRLACFPRTKPDCMVFFSLLP